MRAGHADPVTGITPREREILRLYALGLSERGVAARLGVSHSTVKAQLAVLFARWGICERRHYSMVRMAVVVALARRVLTVAELADGLTKELLRERG